jgi:hypothetical protein
VSGICIDGGVSAWILSPYTHDTRYLVPGFDEIVDHDVDAMFAIYDSLGSLLIDSPVPPANRDGDNDGIFAIYDSLVILLIASPVPPTHRDGVSHR